MSIIQTRGLTKRFGDLVAVDGIDLDIGEGEIFGLLGPNGAGKTTTIRMLCGLAKPSDGRAEVCGHDIVKQSTDVRRCMGVVPQGNVLDRDLSVRQNLVYHAKLHGMQKSVYKKRVEETLTLVGLADRIDSPPLTLSGGMKRRATIAKALVHEPKVLVLDEPTTGLDPQGRRAVWNRIKLLRDKRGITVLLTTHYMEEADVLCDRVAIIHEGKIVALGTLDGLKQQYEGGDIIELTLGELADLKGLEGLDFVNSVETWEGGIRVCTTHRKQALTYLMDRYGKQLENITVRQPTLEDVFIQITGTELDENRQSAPDRNQAGRLMS